MGVGKILSGDDSLKSFKLNYCVLLYKSLKIRNSRIIELADGFSGFYSEYVNHPNHKIISDIFLPPVEEHVN